MNIWDIPYYLFRKYKKSRITKFAFMSKSGPRVIQVSQTEVKGVYLLLDRPVGESDTLPTKQESTDHIEGTYYIGFCCSTEAPDLCDFIFDCREIDEKIRKHKLFYHITLAPMEGLGWDVSVQAYSLRLDGVVSKLVHSLADELATFNAKLSREGVLNPV